MIDVQVSLERLDPSLELAGFEAPFGGVVEDHVPDAWQKLYFRSPARDVHVHVRAAGARTRATPCSSATACARAPEARAAWGETKRREALEPPGREAYKDPLTDVLMVDAERWAAATGWSSPA